MLTMKVSLEKRRGHKRVLSTNLKSKKDRKIRKRSPSTSSSSSLTSSSSTSSFSSSTSSSSSSTTYDSDERLKIKRKNRKAKSPSSDTSSPSSSSSSGKKQKKKTKIIKDNEIKRKLKKCKKKNSKVSVKNKGQKEEASADVPLHLMENPKTIAPMTKEQWEKQQSVVRKVFDETTGRHRLIKGDGEVIEEIVSREQHKKINAQATRGDGDYFQKKLSSNTSR